MAKTPNVPPSLQPPPPTDMSSSPFVEPPSSILAPAPPAPLPPLSPPSGSPPFVPLAQSNRYLTQQNQFQPQPMPPMVMPQSQYPSAILGSFSADLPSSDNPRTDHLTAQHRLKTATADQNLAGVGGTHQGVLSSFPSPFQSSFFPPLVPSAPLLHYLGGDPGILPTYGLQLMSPALGRGYSGNRFGTDTVKSCVYFFS